MTEKAQSDLFISVIDTHKGILHKVANVYARDAESKKDLVQEIVAQLWKSFGNYDPQFKYSTWIYKVALNVSLAWSRKEHNRSKHVRPFPEDLLNLASAGERGDTSTDERGADETNFARLQQFILELKELDRAILLLYLDERSQKEMAEIIGITTTNISTRINRIKGTLRQKFTQLQDQ
ncbi:MAG TPA: sigma-70 family RNA polymerase sigma factor [Puia sp.]|jgi:RNA polymerase sigma-70 factor (ECF subfamily)|nr:sigma-70 family RNA polymerase sigma factor [Puia sp.]